MYLIIISCSVRRIISTMRHSSVTILLPKLCYVTMNNMSFISLSATQNSRKVASKSQNRRITGYFFDNNWEFDTLMHTFVAIMIRASVWYSQYRIYRSTELLETFRRSSLLHLHLEHVWTWGSTGQSWFWSYRVYQPELP